VARRDGGRLAPPLIGGRRGSGVVGVLPLSPQTLCSGATLSGD